MSILSDLTITALCLPPYRHENKLIANIDGKKHLVTTLTIDNHDRPMIAPFVPEQVKYHKHPEGGTVRVISHGLSSYGYDVSLQRDKIELFTNVNSGIIDPMRIDHACFHSATIHTDEETGLEYFLLPPNSYALGNTVEYFHIPRNVNVIALGKSTYARSGVAVNVTPVEAEFEGEVVIEIANQTQLPVRVYLETGIAQFQFFAGDQPCETSYADRGGKYQGQTGITHSKV